MITGTVDEVAAAASGEILPLVAVVLANAAVAVVAMRERTIGKRE